MGYYHNAAWRKLRAMQLRRYPLCCMCLQRGDEVPAVEVDHIIQRDHGGPDNLSNLQSLCRFHHGRKTRSEHTKDGNTNVGIKDRVHTKDTIIIDVEVNIGGMAC